MSYIDFWKQEFSDSGVNIVLCRADGKGEEFLMTVSPSCGRTIHDKTFALYDIFKPKAYEITCTTLIPVLIFEAWVEVKGYFEEAIRKNPQSAWESKYQRYVDYATTHVGI
jgi:hypothetical protein